MLRRYLVVTALLAGLFMAQPRDAHAITWGELDPTGHTYSVLILSSLPSGDIELCSGAMITQRFVLTAAHCLDGTLVSLVLAGFNANVPLGLVNFLSYRIHPDFVAIGEGPDIALIDLGFDTGIAPAQLPAADQLEAGKKGPVTERTFETIGYGSDGVSANATEAKNPLAEVGFRQVGEQTLLSINQGVGGGLYAQFSSNAGIVDGGACFGDSGGPVLPKGTDTVVAVNSFGTNVNCAGMSVSSRVDHPDVLSFINGIIAP